MYIDSTYNYIHDFGSFLKYAKMKVESAIENGRSLKLRQMRQCRVSESFVHYKHATDHERSYTAHQWVVRRVRSG